MQLWGSAWRVAGTITTLLGTSMRVVMTILALALVLFLAWALLRWMNRRMPGMAGGGAARMIKVLDRVQAGKSSTLLLVRVQDKVFLLGAGDRGVDKICEFDDPEGKLLPPAIGEPPSFAAALRDAAAKAGFGKKKTEGDDAP